MAKKRSKNRNKSSSVSVSKTQESVSESGSEAVEKSAVENKKSDTMPKASAKLARAADAAAAASESGTKIFLVLAFFIPFLIMGYMFARAGVFPFGERQVLYSDCKQQYYPFLKEFQSKLQSGDSMLYSWRNGLGTNFIAMIAYYIASPLNLLTFFVPREYVREAMAVFMMMKIGFASLFTAVFLKHVFRRNDLSLVAFGCCYAFCDFIMGYYWNTIWLDSVALLPLVALGVYCVVNEDKFKLYIVALALSFWSSYYIGFMICIFVLIWFVIQSVIKGSKFEEFCSNVVKMAIYSVIALAATLPITLTAYIQLSNTAASNDKFPEKLELYNNFMEMIANLMSFNKQTTMEGLPNIGCGVVCVLLVVIFIRAKEISKKEKITYLALLGFMFISLNLNSLDYIWHGFHFPNQIPYRFAFLFSFVLICIAYRAFTAFVKLDKTDIIGTCILAIAMVCVAVFYLDKAPVIGSLIVAGIYILFMSLHEMNLLSRRWLINFVSVLIIVEMAVQAHTGVETVGTTNHNNFPDAAESVDELVNYAEDKAGGDLFRIEQTNYSSKNDGMIYGYNGIGQFSSTSYKTIIDFTSKFGMVSKRSSYQYLLTSPVTSMFLNVKYVISRDNYTAGETSLTQVKRSQSDPTAYLYENAYYLPIGYMADNKIMNVDMENNTVFETQNNIFKSAAGINDNVYTLLEPSKTDLDGMTVAETSDKLYSYSFMDGISSGKIAVTYTAPKDGMLYAWANVKSTDTLTVESDKLKHDYSIEAQRYIFPLGNYKKGETVTIKVNAGKSGKNIICAAYLDPDVMDKGYANLSDEGLKITNYSSTKIEGTIVVKNSGTFCTSIPYEKGWTLYVDGEKTETSAAMDVFLAADMSAGKHDIKLVYSPEGFRTGIILCILAIIGFAVLCVLDYKNKRKNNK